MLGVLGGCDLHGQTREGVLAACRHSKTIKALEEGTPRLVPCVDCDGPALAVMVLEDELPGGVSAPVLCKACSQTTLEQLQAMIARLAGKL